MNSKVVAAAAAAFAAAVTCGAPAMAHHSFAMFDMAKSSTIEGTVQKFEWSNPHCWLFVVVPGDKGGTSYGFEMQSVGELLRRGWTKTTFKVGDKVKIQFHPLKDGTPAGQLTSAWDGQGKLLGRPIGGGPPGGEGPPPGGAGG